MTITLKNVSEPEVSCSNCKACCCRLEVMLITDTDVPDIHISVDQWGGETMLRLEDGWCSALDRESFMCSIYENRPWICREFEMGSYECKTERAEQMPLTHANPIEP
jgi:Fe-S-cluster containining protein